MPDRLGPAALFSSAVVVRPARLDDAPALAAYMAALRREGLDTISFEPASTVEDERERVLQASLSPRLLLLLAVREAEVIGILELAAGRRDDDRHSGRLALSIARTWRGRGVGGRLLRAAIDEVRAWPGFCRIELECASWNAPAIALYQSLGFILEGRRRKALNLRGQPEDALLMALVW